MDENQIYNLLIEENGTFTPLGKAFIRYVAENCNSLKDLKREFNWRLDASEAKYVAPEGAVILYVCGTNIPFDNDEFLNKIKTQMEQYDEFYVGGSRVAYNIMLEALGLHATKSLNIQQIEEIKPSNLIVVYNTRKSPQLNSLIKRLNCNVSYYNSKDYDRL